jgi:acyl carrier protein
MRAFVQAYTAQVLGINHGGAIESDRSFRELGFTSLAALELRNQLSYATGLRLPAGLAFDYPTPGALARYLGSGELGEGLYRRPAGRPRLPRSAGPDLAALHPPGRRQPSLPTGDIARLLPSGELTFVSRVDDQTRRGGTPHPSRARG